MNRVFASDPGFRSRIAHHVELSADTPDELRAMAVRVLTVDDLRTIEAAEMPASRVLKGGIEPKAETAA